MDANSIIHHASSLYQEYPKLPAYKMTVVNRLFLGIIHARLDRQMKDYSDFDKAIKEIRRECRTDKEKNFITNLYEICRESDLKLTEINFLELSGLMKRAKEYHSSAF